MMEQLRRPRVLVAVLAVIVVIVALAVVFGGADAADSTASISAKVKSGEFRVVVTTTGELRARKAVQIQGPPNMQAAQVYQTRISSLVPEGTVVKAGDVVAELDRSAIAGKHQEVSLALQKAEAQYTQAELDSALSLATAREEIRTLELGLEEKRIARDQSKYEAPSVRRQADIEHEKAERAFAQAKANYITKKQQSIAKMREVGSELERQRNQLNIIRTAMEGFTIKAPAPGMVIYDKEWNGRKKVVGSQVSAWDPTVATLPDLTQMESVTYVNEIDVRKIAVGQDRKSTRLNSSHSQISYAVFCLKKKKKKQKKNLNQFYQITYKVRTSPFVGLHHHHIPTLLHTCLIVCYAPQLRYDCYV